MIYIIVVAAVWSVVSYRLFWQMHYQTLEQFGSVRRGDALLHLFAAVVFPGGLAVIFFESPRVRAWMRREWP